MSQILVIAGTAEATNIINKLLEINVGVIATVTTRLGSDLLKNIKRLHIYEGRMTQKNLSDLIIQNDIICIIDASNPFATDISQNAVSVCKKNKILYSRFEREETLIQGEDIIRVKSHEEALERLLTLQGNIMLTLGSGKIDIFTKIPNYKERVFLRLLPDGKVISKCEKLGFNAKNLIAIKGPFAEELNIQLLKYCNASVLVTKESGNTGGTIEKINAARVLNIPVIMIDRTQIEYENKVTSVEEMICFVKTIQSSYRNENIEVG
ncbi:precorrin-6A reductase [Alkalibaculum sp. M08DMB]|uniref:Precorrin-6A reductase n=1 Tax=Alkalibaculum sporogenes TaxID=2655001 RepID=A0A6A7K676_9FIRM|nr:precorrin-6A reductase [Alkalibaculum sporogenes]MPW24948.1 precorrin-6A reductase [Alkalibaculum sporogenes]